MSEKKKFTSLSEAMASLPESTRKHSERVADYMKVLFTLACVSDELLRESKSETRLRDELTDMAYDAGYYHDIGKAFIPAELHQPSEDFSGEEKALYRRHVDHGAKLLFDMYRAEKKCSARAEDLVHEAVENSHELWNGSGFPQGLEKKNISVLSRLLAVADTLDHVSSETRCENPFDYAIDYINWNSDVLFDPRVVKIVNEYKPDLRVVFSRIEADTQIIPKVEPIAPLSAKKIIKLKYRPILSKADKKTVACEAVSEYRIGQNWYGAEKGAEVLADTKEQKLPELRRGAGILITSIACDMLRHCDLAEIALKDITINLPIAFLKQRTGAADVISIVKDEEIDPSRVRIAIDAKQFLSSAVLLKKNVEALKNAGIKTVICGVTISEKETETPKDSDRAILTVKQIIETGASVFRLDGTHAADADDKEAVERLVALRDAGFEFTADNLDDPKADPALNLLCVNEISGDIRGVYLEESDFIASEIAASKEN